VLVLAPAYTPALPVVGAHGRRGVLVPHQMEVGESR
jgi:hypothetical protein